MRRDAIFYQLFKRFPSLFFELVGFSPEQAQGYRFESVEIKEPSFRIDGVFLPPDEASPKIVFFVEVQFQKDQTLYHRFFSELFLYLYRNSSECDDWRGVLIFPHRAIAPDENALHRALLQSDQVQCLYLDEMGDDSESSVGLRLMQLTLATQTGVIEQAKRLIAQAQTGEIDNLSPTAIINIVTTIAVYKFASLSRSEVEAMLGLRLEETRVYREAKEEGREEGRLEAKLEMIPLLSEIGLTAEQIAERLKLDLTLVQQAMNAQNQ